jgi:PKD repeat protein
MRWHLPLTCVFVSVLVAACTAAGAGGGGGGDGSPDDSPAPAVVADAGGPYALLWHEPPIRVDFDASGTIDSHGEVATYRWDPGDGSPPLESGHYAASHDYAADAPAEYEVTLTVHDAGGTELSSDRTVVRLRSSPVAAFEVATAPDALQVGEPATFDASASTDGDGLGFVASYLWDFDYGGDFSVDLRSTSSTMTTVLYDPGEVTVALVVVNDDGFYSEPTTVDIDVADADGAVIIIQ